MLIRLLAAALVALALQASAQAAPAVIPAPLAAEPRAGSFLVADGTPVAVPPGDRGALRVARRLDELLNRTAGIDLQVGQGRRPRPGIIRLVRSQTGLGPEGYRLLVGSDGAVVTASDDAGLLYGAVTFWQLATAEPSAQETVRVQGIDIRDRPRFRWRGLMLDSARHYQSPAYIKRFIDWMALHKLNTLHWHLTDDQGWRLEIKKYPRLTEVGAWRTPASAPGAPRPPRQGGFYTQAQVRELVAYAAERNVAIVPEIDLPGHATAAIAAYPWLAVTSPAPAEVPADWGVYPHLFNPEERTLRFLEDVLAEVVRLFPGRYVHLGGDEAVKDQWRASPRVQARMRELGLKNENELQSWFMRRLEAFLNARGRRLVGWDEILDGGVAPNATIMSWRGSEGAVAAARMGHDAVLSPAPDLYLDNRQSEHDGSPGRGKVISLESVYRFEAVPAGLTPEQHGRILGLQANLWTEHMRSEDRVTYQAYPRVAALAEAAWTEQRDWEGFKARLRPQLERYRRLGIGYAPRALDGIYAPPPQLAADERFDHQMKLCSEAIALSLVDDAPLEGERAAFLMDIMNPCWTWSGADLTGVSALEIDVGQVPFNFQIGKDVEKIRFRRPRTPEGELEVRLGGCDGPLAASAPLAAAARNPGVTTLRVPLPGRSGPGRTLCFSFTQHGVNPLWGVDRVKLIRGGR